MLRKALGETSKENRYILTVPGRGYQFAAPMETEAPRMLVHAAHTQTTAVIEEEYVDAFPEKPLEKLPAATRAKGRWIWGGMAVLGMMAAAGTIVYRVHQRPAPVGPREIVVADFVNRSKDPAFGPTLRRALEIDLGQSPYFSILAQPMIAETLRMMGRPANDNLTGP